MQKVRRGCLAAKQVEEGFGSISEVMMLKMMMLKMMKMKMKNLEWMEAMVEHV